MRTSDDDDDDDGDGDGDGDEGDEVDDNANKRLVGWNGS